MSVVFLLQMKRHTATLNWRQQSRKRRKLTIQWLTEKKVIYLSFTMLINWLLSWIFLLDNFNIVSFSKISIVSITVVREEKYCFPVFYYCYMVEEVLFLRQRFGNYFLMILHVLKAPESKKYAFNGFIMCVSVISITQK